MFPHAGVPHGQCRIGHSRAPFSSAALGDRLAVWMLIVNVHLDIPRFSTVNLFVFLSQGRESVCEVQSSEWKVLAYFLGMFLHMF